MISVMPFLFYKISWKRMVFHHTFPLGTFLHFEKEVL